MTGLPASSRRSIAARIREMKEEVAREVVGRLRRAHPDWWAGIDGAARAHCHTDVAYHVEFLAGAVELDDPALFADYARWISRVLSARGVALDGVRESLEWLGEELAPRLGREEMDMVGTSLATGVENIALPPARNDLQEGAEGPGLVRSMFLQAVLRGEREAAFAVAADALEQGTDFVDLYVDVFQEALYEVGRLWESNRIPVAVEHMATATTQFVLARMYTRIPRPCERSGRAVITGVEGEQHQVGGYMVADILEAGGWDVRFLGTNMPHEGIRAAVVEHDADLLGISVTMVANLPRTADLIGDIRGRRDLRIIVGGGAFRSSERAWKEVGADGFAADLRTVSAIAAG